MLHKNLTFEKNEQNYLKQLQGPIAFLICKILLQIYFSSLSLQFVIFMKAHFY